MTWVRKVPGVRNLPRCRLVRPKTMFTLSGRPMPGVVADQLPGEDPPGDRPVQGHGRGEPGLPARQLPAVVGVLVGAGERLRQPGQPLAGEPVDLLVGQPVADPLDRLRVADGAERVIQGRERDAFLQALPLGVLGQYAERPAMPHEAETRPVTLGSRMRETAFLCRLRRPDLVACPSLWCPSPTSMEQERSRLLRSGA